MEEFLKQSKEREEASQRLFNSMQSEIQQLKSRITDRPENIDIPSYSQAPKYTTPKFSGLIKMTNMILIPGFVGQEDIY
jgi:ABC-type Fe3+-hydroxamate transport system substrate-binding protein